MPESITQMTGVGKERGLLFWNRGSTLVKWSIINQIKFGFALWKKGDVIPTRDSGYLTKVGFGHWKNYVICVVTCWYARAPPMGSQHK
jgi:hypothetical protein